MRRVECMMVVKHLLTRRMREKVVRGTRRIEWGWLGRGKGAKDFFWAHILPPLRTSLVGGQGL